MQLDAKSRFILEVINKRFIQLVAGSKSVAVDVTSGDEIGKEGFLLYCNQHYGKLTGTEKDTDGTEKTAEVAAGTAWWTWSDPEKRVVRRIVLEPGVDSPRDVYNRWDDLKHTMCTPDKDATIDDIMPLIEHLRFISDGDGDGVAFLLNWLAQLYQTPSIKMPHAIMLYSRRSRMGKSMLWELLSRVFGEPMVGQYAGKELHSKWLGDIVGGKRLIVWNELSRQDRTDGYESFKTFVSERRQIMEGKGTKHKELDCYAHNIITTNNSDALPLMEGDGRILVLRCEAERRPNDYYKEFHRWCTEEGPAKVAGMFAKWVFPEGWDPLAPVPQTKAVRATQIESRSSLHRFVQELIEERKPPFDRDFGASRDIQEQVATLYPANFKGLRLSDRTLGAALRDLGAEQRSINYYKKDGSRSSARLWVWRHQSDWTVDVLKNYLEKNDI